jgi:hypothetical protein
VGHFRAGVVEVIIGLFLAVMENTLSTIEASGVIALRVQMISQGGPAAQVEAELMVTEKMRAFTQAATDIAHGASPAEVCEGFRSAIRANYNRLSIATSK